MDSMIPATKKELSIIFVNAVTALSVFSSI